MTTATGRAQSIADGIFLLGGLAPLDGRISLAPREARGSLSFNGYAVVEGADCVVVDSGMPIHEEAVLAQLDALRPPVERLKLVVTRGVEFDSIGNLTAILRTQPAVAIYSHFPSPAWFQLDPRFDVDDEAARRAAATPSLPLEEGSPVPVDDAGTRTLEVLPPVLRLLQASWLFDRKTGTLFTSDAFGYATSADGERVVDAGNDRLTRDEIAAGLAPKFDWLRDADPAETVDAIRGLFAEHDVRVIAPSVGCVLAGRDVVRRHVEIVLDILTEWSDADAV